MSGLGFSFFWELRCLSGCFLQVLARLTPRLTVAVRVAGCFRAFESKVEDSGFRLRVSSGFRVQHFMVSSLRVQG